MIHKKSFLFFTALAGFLTLSFFAVIQRKIMGFGFISDPRSFAVPLLYGGTIGLLLGLRQMRIWKNEADLQATVEELQEQREELQHTEDMLRKQVEEYVETQEHLVANEYLLQEQYDELLATEEMLRVQIEESEAGRQMLQETNINLQTIFNVSPLAIAIFSYPEGDVRKINQKFSDDFGYTHENIVGRKAGELGLWGNHNENQRFQELINDQQGALSGFDTEIRTSGGVTRNVLIYSNFIEHKGEKCQLTVYTDVTEQRKMEEIIRQTQKMEVIGRLAGGVAHDFNNMLSAIMASAEILANCYNNDPKPMKFVSTILEAANRSAGLTQQLLAFSHKGQNTSVPVCMNDTIKAVITMLERTIDKKISLKTIFTANQAKIAGDPALLQNALLNLAINSRDAMPEGGSITFATSNVDFDKDSSGAGQLENIPAGRYLEISVEDTGSGMTDEVLKHIFEPFYTTKEIGKGTGLGLASVYGTVKQHHGFIQVHSEPEVGTTFKLYFPLVGDGKCATSRDEDFVSGSGGILLVDDEEMIRSTGRMLLEELGYSVYLAEDGKMALEVYGRESDNISLVILDMIMPRMGGREALLQLMAKFPDARVLITSGFHQEGTKEELLHDGALGFIQKPFSKIELCRAVAMATGDTSRSCSDV